MLILLFLALPFLIVAQSNSSVDFIGSVDYTYRYFKADENFDDSIRKKEKGNLNWRLGFNYNQRLSERLFLKTGLRLMSLGYHREYNFGELRWGTQHDGEGNFDPNISPDESFPNTKVSTNYVFLEVPLVLRYEFTTKKITPYIEAGFGSAYVLQIRNTTSQEGERKSNTTSEFGENFNRFQLEGIISFGVNYNLNANWQLFTQPTFRYHLTELTDFYYKEHLWSAGLELGVRRGLN